jgi:hypothetical protein
VLEHDFLQCAILGKCSLWLMEIGGKEIRLVMKLGVTCI